MGNANWGGGDSCVGKAQWQGDQWDSPGEWDTIPLRSCDARYRRALAMLGPAPIATHNAFAPIADTSDSYNVPISKLVTNRRKPQKQTRHIATAHKKFCATDCGCRDHRPQEDWLALEVQCSYDILLRGSEWYPPAQTSLTTSIAGGGGLGGSGASHSQEHGLKLPSGAPHAQGHGGGFQTAESDFVF